MKLLKHIFSILSCTLLLFGCTKNFEKFNTNPIGLTQQQLDADFTYISALLHQAQRFIISQDVGTYQLAENLSSDSYAGYMGAEAPFRSNSNNLNYDLVDGWNASIWTSRYTNVMNPTYKIIELAKEDEKLKDLDALARILRVSAMSRVSDKIGPIIYSQYNILNEKDYVAYDAQKDVYPLFFEDLELAINTLKGLADGTVSEHMKKSDKAYTADNYKNWLAYANTLRLRLALRVVYIDPGMAKIQGEAALDPANGGLLTENSQNCFIALNAPTHPLNIIGYEWSDTRMGAPMESILGGYNDPRLPKYFEPATDPALAGQYKGIRAGIEIDEKSRYDGHSKLDFYTENRMQLMVAAESWFLKAEAALRGWANAGNIQVNYETGIERSLSMYSLGAAAATYINDAVSKPKPYIDPKSVNPGQNNIPTGSPYLSTITKKWDNADNANRKLERIITQKWIAIFPDGGEAWAEYRRTGYPILFPVVINKSGGLIPTIPGVRRIPIPQAEYNTNNGGAVEAETMLGGPNTGATRLWWDVVDKSL